LVFGDWNLRFICDVGFDIWLLGFPQTAKFLLPFQLIGARETREKAL
jgi:hypothetical protein